jgi:hypothetical protein
VDTRVAVGPSTIITMGACSTAPDISGAGAVAIATPTVLVICCSASTAGAGKTADAAAIEATIGPGWLTNELSGAVADAVPDGGTTTTLICGLGASASESTIGMTKAMPGTGPIADAVASAATESTVEL